MLCFYRVVGRFGSVFCCLCGKNWWKKAHGCTLGEESATLIFALGIENGKEQPGCRVPIGNPKDSVLGNLGNRTGNIREDEGNHHHPLENPIIKDSLDASY